MNDSQKMFRYIQDSLIEWKPKVKPEPTQGSAGFDTNNVMEIEMGSPPNKSIFDYVYFAPPTSRVTSLTTSSRGLRQRTTTFMLYMYCKRLGVGNAGKRATLEAMHETTDYLTKLLTDQGMLVVVPMVDLNYNNNDIARVSITATRKFMEK